MKKLEEYFDIVGSKNGGNYVARGSWPDRAQQKIQKLMVREVIASRAKSLIDLGCGNGELIRELFNKNHGLVLSGVDFSKQMIIQAKQLQPRIRWIEANITSVPLKGAQIVSCVNVLHHFSPTELDKVLREITRLSKKNIILEIKNGRTLFGLFMWMDLKFFKRIPVYLHDHREIEKKLKEQGFRKRKVKWLFGNELISPFGLFVFEREN